MASKKYQQNTDKKGLSVEQQRSVEYIHKQLHLWKEKDLVLRQRISLADLADLISEKFANPQKKLTGAAVGLWLRGGNIPNSESAWALSQFFGTDPEETFAAFGHDFQPPLTFTAFYEQVKTIAEKEEWQDADLILSHLEKTTDWDHKIAPVVHGLAIYVLNSSQSISMRARQLKDLIVMMERADYLGRKTSH